MSRTQHHTRRRLNRFVTRAGNLEINLVLPFEEDFAVVNATREIHRSERLNETVTPELPGAGPS